MQAFQNDHGLKADLLARTTARNDAASRTPEWANANYANYTDQSPPVCEEEVGLPALLARIQERIFIRMSSEKARTFPQLFVAAIPVGSDPTLKTRQFLHAIAADFVAQVGDEAMRLRFVPVLDISARWAAGENVAVTAMQDALGPQRQPSEKEIDADPIGFACESIVRLTDPHLVNPEHGADVMMSTIAYHLGVNGKDDHRAAIFDGFAEQLLAFLKKA